MLQRPASQGLSPSKSASHDTRCIPPPLPPAQALPSSPPASVVVWPAWVLAALWGVGLALPAWLSGALVGQPFTDLYPAVWGMWLAADHWPFGVTHTTQLAFPNGMGFYYSSPVKGWLAGVLLPWLGTTHTWNLLLVAARVATVGLSAHAARAWGLKGPGVLVVAAGFGCSAVFQGYAVEGIVEGTDGWPLALWAWSVARDRRGWSIVALALCVVSSWYLGAVVCLLAVLACLRFPHAAWSLAGLVLAGPAIWAFVGAFSGAEPLDPLVRAAMGAPIQVPRPGVLEGLYPFALTAYTGVALGLTALGARQRWVVLAAVPAVLSLGMGPLYELPGLSALRFPYRWHLATLAILSLAAGRLADRVRWGWWLGPAIVMETLLLAPVEPVLPGASATVPALYAAVDGPVLDIPGPVALPPGEINASRPRSRWYLFAQTRHGQPTPWVPDFNSVGTGRGDPEWEAVAAVLQNFDRVADGDGEATVPADLVQRLSRLGVRWIVVHHSAPGLVGAARLKAGFLAQGAVLVEQDQQRWLLKLPS